MNVPTCAVHPTVQPTSLINPCPHLVVSTKRVGDGRTWLVWDNNIDIPFFLEGGSPNASEKLHAQTERMKFCPSFEGPN